MKNELEKWLMDLIRGANPTPINFEDMYQLSVEGNLNIGDLTKEEFNAWAEEQDELVQKEVELLDTKVGFVVEELWNCEHPPDEVETDENKVCGSYIWKCRKCHYGECYRTYEEYLEEEENDE